MAGVSVTTPTNDVPHASRRRGRFKRFIFRDSVPYELNTVLGTRVRFVSVHCQRAAKAHDTAVVHGRSGLYLRSWRRAPTVPRSSCP
jgi:hypothetical protein